MAGAAAVAGAAAGRPLRRRREPRLGRHGARRSDLRRPDLRARLRRHVRRLPQRLQGRRRRFRRRELESGLRGRAGRGLGRLRAVQPRLRRRDARLLRRDGALLLVQQRRGAVRGDPGPPAPHRPRVRGRRRLPRRERRRGLGVVGRRREPLRVLRRFGRRARLAPRGRRRRRARLHGLVGHGQRRPGLRPGRHRRVHVPVLRRRRGRDPLEHGGRDPVGPARVRRARRPRLRAPRGVAGGILRLGRRRGDEPRRASGGGAGPRTTRRARWRAPSSRGARRSRRACSRR